MTPHEARIQDHEEMLAEYRKKLAKYWPIRDKNKDMREMVKSFLQQANFHKNMITQLNELGPWVELERSCFGSLTF